MTQSLWIILIVFGSIGSVVYFRYIKNDYLEHGNILLVLGLIFIVIGSIFVSVIHDFYKLIDCLILRDSLLSGKLILIGYFFLTISIFINIEKVLRKWLGRFKKFF